jgi:hypothetical protein
VAAPERSITYLDGQLEDGRGRLMHRRPELFAGERWGRTLDALDPLEAINILRFALKGRSYLTIRAGERGPAWPHGGTLTVINHLHYVQYLLGVRIIER